jgi:hypothetical protein
MTGLPQNYFRWCADIWGIGTFLPFGINRDWASVGLESLVPIVGIHLHRNSYNAYSFVHLQAISSHPLMSKTVRELYYDSHTVASPMKDFATWKAEVEKWLKVQNSGRVKVLEFNPIRAPDDFELLYRWCQTIMEEQAYYLNEGKDFLIVEQALTNLTNLEKIAMNTYNVLYKTDVYDRIEPWDYTLGQFPEHQIKPPGMRQLNFLLAVASCLQDQIEKASSRITELALVLLACFPLQERSDHSGLRVSDQSAAGVELWRGQVHG